MGGRDYPSGGDERTATTLSMKRNHVSTDKVFCLLTADNAGIGGVSEGETNWTLRG